LKAAAIYCEKIPDYFQGIIMEFFVFLRLINKYITPYRWLAFFILVRQVFEAGFDSTMRMSLKFIIDAAIIPKNFGLLILILLLLVGGAIILTFVGLLGDFYTARFGVLVSNNIRHSLFERIQSLSMEFFGRRSSGDIVNCFLADVEKVENSLSTGLAIVVLDLSGILFSAIFLFSLNWQLAVLSCIGLTFCILAPAKLVSALPLKATYCGKKKDILPMWLERIFSLNQLSKSLAWKNECQGILLPI
jgi:ATP-binding cassette subfamily B protein